VHLCSYDPALHGRHVPGEAWQARPDEWRRWWPPVRPLALRRGTALLSAAAAGPAGAGIPKGFCSGTGEGAGRRGERRGTAAARPGLVCRLVSPLVVVVAPLSASGPHLPPLCDSPLQPGLSGHRCAAIAVALSGHRAASAAGSGSSVSSAAPAPRAAAQSRGAVTRSSHEEQSRGAVTRSSHEEQSRGAVTRSYGHSASDRLPGPRETAGCRRYGIYGTAGPAGTFLSLAGPAGSPCGGRASVLHPVRRRRLPPPAGMSSRRTRRAAARLTPTRVPRRARRGRRG
jgi:hypothetical protein